MNAIPHAKRFLHVLYMSDIHHVKDFVKSYSSREGLMGVPYPMRRMMIDNA